MEIKNAAGENIYDDLFMSLDVKRLRRRVLRNSAGVQIKDQRAKVLIDDVTPAL